MPLSLSCLNLPVVTVGGRSLGRVVGVEVDESGRHVAYYQVAPLGAPLGGLWHKKLLIAPSQVIKLTAEAMVVDDSSVGEAAGRQPNLAPTPTA